MPKARVLLTLCCFFLSACGFSLQKMDYHRANQAMERGQADEAIKGFSRILKRYPNSELALESARKAARLSLLDKRDFLSAIEFYRFLILNSKDPVERIDAQKSIANIQFEKTRNFEAAIIEYNRLLTLPLPKEELFEFRLNIAKAYFQLNNFFQSQSEVESLLSQKLSSQQRFDLMLFKANLLMTDKKDPRAIEILTEIMNQFPELAKKENVPLTLAVFYEETQDFSKAISILTDLMEDYPNPEFLELKIKRLKERQGNLPGARGWRK